MVQTIHTIIFICMHICTKSFAHSKKCTVIKALENDSWIGCINFQQSFDLANVQQYLALLEKVRVVQLVLLAYRGALDVIRWKLTIDSI